MKRLVLALVVACTPHATAVSAWDKRVPQACGAPQPFTENAGELRLEGLSPEVRVKLDQRALAQDVAVLHIERTECDVRIEVLACTRPTRYFTRVRNTGALDLVSPADVAELGGIAGGGTLASVAAGHGRVSIDHRTTTERVVTWEEDLRSSGFQSRWGTWVAKDAPPLAREELSGSDCARATHWATAVHDGAFRVLADDETIDATACASCKEPVAIQLARVFDYGALQKDPSVERAAREPYLPPNAQLGDYEAAVALANLGYLAAADAQMKQIAEQNAHPHRNHAAFWLTVRDRRYKSEP